MIEVYLDEVTASGESPSGEVRVKLDKLLARSGLADSVSDASRKLKQKAVRIDGELMQELVGKFDRKRTELVTRVGRKIKRIVLKARET